MFDESSGTCHDLSGISDALKVPLDEPKLSMFLPETAHVFSQLYDSKVNVLASPNVIIDGDRIEHVRRRIGTQFDPATAGYVGGNSNIDSHNGYFPEFDFNNNGEIDEADLATVTRHIGREMRANLYVHSYFGPDWLTTCVLLDVEQQPGQEVLVDYDYGAGYDARAGLISLFETPGPGKNVWVEYYSDAPDESLMGEMRLILYKEIA
jgi:hypothetical protein